MLEATIDILHTKLGIILSVDFAGREASNRQDRTRDRGSTAMEVDVAELANVTSSAELAYQSLAHLCNQIKSALESIAIASDS